MSCPCVTELSDVEADSGKEEEDAPEAAAVGNSTRRARPKKKKAHAKKELKGEEILPMADYTVHLKFVS